MSVVVIPSHVLGVELICHDLDEPVAWCVTRDGVPAYKAWEAGKLRGIPDPWEVTVRELVESL